MTYGFLLGSHPTLSMAEVGQVLGKSARLSPLIASPTFNVAKYEGDLPDNFIDRLGGTERIMVIVGERAAWEAEDILHALDPLPHKLMVGLSTSQAEFDVQPLAEKLKTAARARKIKIRFVLPRDRLGMLNAAQVIFNKLDRKPNLELILARGENGPEYLLRTREVQDISAYELRDTRRPARPKKVGMLPPKLAQMMINIAVGDKKSGTILDPFCGAGTVLQEGQLMGYQMVGSDAWSQMITATEKNLAWLAQNFDVSADPTPQIFRHDAREPFPRQWWGKIDAIVTEPHLGPALRSPLPRQEAQAAFLKLGELYVKAFGNFRPLLPQGGKILFIMPAFATERGRDYAYFPEKILDAISALGYRRMHPLGSRERLFYARPDAFVGRELTLWEKNHGT